MLLLRPVTRHSKSQFILECVDKWRTERRSFKAWSYISAEDMIAKITNKTSLSPAVFPGEPALQMESLECAAIGEPLSGKLHIPGSTLIGQHRRTDYLATRIN